MAPESLLPMVFSKFDMHIYTSTLTTKELKVTITEYCIPTDLHPSLPPLELIMDKLPLSYIRIYLEQLELGDLRDDFPMNYNGNDDACLDEFTIPLRTPPRHLLYVCGLTTACQHPERSYLIKDPNGTVLTIDDFLKLPIWSGTVMSKRDPILDDQRPQLRTTTPLEVGKLIPEKSLAQGSLERPNSKIADAQEKKDQQNLAKAKAKRSGEEGSVVPRKKRVCRIKSLMVQGDARPKPRTTDIERDVVDLSEGTRLPTPPVNVIHPSTHTGHGGHSFHSAHHGDTG
ncbi:hypothetical protein Tco_1515254 [Tanacetum coccineum]